MAEASRLGMMAQNTMEIGAKVSPMALAKFSTQMAINTRENSKMVKEMDSVGTYMPMVKSMLDIGRMTIKMVLAEKNYKMAPFSLATLLKV